MAADLFVASFLGCLFALVVVTIGAAQIAKWKIRRVIRESAGDITQWLEQSADGDPQMRAELDRLGRLRVSRMEAVLPPAIPATGGLRCACASEIMIPVVEDRLTWAHDLGWLFDLSRDSQDGSAAVRGWTCPTCVARDSARARSRSPRPS